VVISATGGLTVGRNVHIGAHCCLSGAAPIELADFCGLSQGVRIFSSSDDYSGDSLTNPTVPDAFKANKSLPVRLGRHSIIGANSVILPGSDIGEGGAVGALSLVNRNLDASSIYAGAPARLVRSRSRRPLQLEGEYLRGK
jgi:acetyltransferase-like isoleucine patch superfamily enzyme